VVNVAGHHQLEAFHVDSRDTSVDEFPIGYARFGVRDRLEATAAAGATDLRLEPLAARAAPVRLQRRALSYSAAPTQEVSVVLELHRALEDRDADVLKHVESIVFVAHQQPDSRKNPALMLEQQRDAVSTELSVSAADNLVILMSIV
jgi:hypothetical protein